MPTATKGNPDRHTGCSDTVVITFRLLPLELREKANLKQAAKQLLNTVSREDACTILIVMPCLFFFFFIFSRLPIFQDRTGNGKDIDSLNMTHFFPIHSCGNLYVALTQVSFNHTKVCLSLVYASLNSQKSGNPLWYPQLPPRRSRFLHKQKIKMFQCYEWKHLIRLLFDGEFRTQGAFSSTLRIPHFLSVLNVEYGVSSRLH